MSNDKSVIVRAMVEKEVRNSFKAACAYDGRSMQEVLIDMIGHYIHEIEKDSKASHSSQPTTNLKREVRGEAA